MREQAKNDEIDEFKLSRIFGRVAKIPIASTLNELVGMDSVDFGGQATFRHIRDSFTRFSSISFDWSGKKERRKTAGAIGDASIPHWLSIIGGAGYRYPG